MSSSCIHRCSPGSAISIGRSLLRRRDATFARHDVRGRNSPSCCCLASLPVQAIGSVCPMAIACHLRRVDLVPSLPAPRTGGTFCSRSGLLLVNACPSCTRHWRPHGAQAIGNQFLVSFQSHSAGPSWQRPSNIPRARPNPSLERTSTGKPLGPRDGQCHHPSRGPSTFPMGPAQLKR